jgi:methylene-tetrahydromethanopterin dehydrogenase
MKTLEITPLKDKKLTVFVVEKEYNEPFWIVEPHQTSDSQALLSLLQPSIGFHKFMENFIKKVKPDFATEELGMRSPEEFCENSLLAQMLGKEKIPFFPVDIDGNARTYLAANLNKKKEKRDNLLKTLTGLPKQGEESEKREYLIAHGQVLQLELEEQEHEANFPIRESWIVIGILNRAREVDKREVTCIHVCSPQHVEGIRKLLERLDVKVEVIKLAKKIISANPESPNTSEVESLLRSMQIQVKPVIGKTSQNAPHLLFYLDTDEKPSPFDICMAYDAGFDAVIPYGNVTPKDAKRIVQDAVFSREPKAVKHTCFFIGGKDAEKAEEVFKAAKDSMFPPFKTSIIIDPGGAYTTAAAMVAKVEEALSSHKFGELKTKTCAVLGTGAVGQITAVLLAKLGCEVTIASINPERVDGKEYSERIADFLSNKHGVKIQGIFAPTLTAKLGILEKTDVIFCAGARGARIIEKESLRKFENTKVLVDVNTIPPFGVEGLELKDDMKEIAPDIFGIGALTIGDVKHKLEKEILREALSNGKDIYDYNLAMEIARKLLLSEISAAKLTLTLSYPPSSEDAK